MFILIIIAATLGYALQGVLVAQFYRRHDALTVFTARGLSFGLTLLPLLLWAGGITEEIFPFLTPLIIAGFLTALSGPLQGKSYLYLSIGISNAIYLSTIAVTMLSAGWIQFDERFTAPQYGLISILILCNVFLGLSKDKEPQIDSNHKGYGAILCVIAGILAACGNVIVGATSRDIHPWIAGYFWEASAGFIGVIFILIRKAFFKIPYVSLPNIEIRNILIASSPAVIGTACYTYAMKIGAIGMAGSILEGSQAIVSVILAYMIFRERPTNGQFVAIMVVGCVIALLAH